MAFGLYGSYTGAADFVPGTTQASNYLTNHKFAYNSTAGCWTGEPAAYWPIRHDEKMSFFAYAPYDANGTQVRLNSQAGTIKLLVTPAANSADQIDLCIADARTTRNITFSSLDASDNTIPLTFEHTMVRINYLFRFDKKMGSSEGPDTSHGYFITIGGVTLSGLSSSGEITFSLDDSNSYPYTWSGQSTATTTYSATVTDSNKLVPEATTSGGYADGFVAPMFVVPQSVSGKTLDVAVTYNIMTSEPGSTEYDQIEATITQTVTIPASAIPDSTLTKGQVYNFNVTIGVGIPIEIVPLIKLNSNNNWTWD